MSSSDWVIISQEAGTALLNSPQFAQFLIDSSIDAQSEIQAQIVAGKKLTTASRRNMLKPILMLSTIQNNTGEHIDTRLMTERLRETLFNSGKVRFTTYASGVGQTIDAATTGVRQLANDPNVKQSTVAQKGMVNAPNLSLGGVIIKQTAQYGRDNEMSYTFSLTLTDNVTGEGVWAYTKELKRQNKRGIFGN